MIALHVATVPYLDWLSLKARQPIDGPGEALEARIDALLAAQEPRLIRWLVAEWGGQRADITDAELVAAIDAGSIPAEWAERFHQRYSDFVLERMVPEWTLAANTAAAGIRTGVARLGIDHDWSFLESRIGDFVLARGDRLPVDLTGPQMDALRAVLHHHIVEDPISSRELTRLLKPVVGLTEQQAATLVRYRASLVEAGTPASRIERMVERHARQLHTRRAETIARTEMAFAYNGGARAAVEDVASAGGFSSPVVRVWHTGRDERTCPQCGALHEQQAQMEGLYPDGTSAPPAHPRCRCCELFEVDQTAPPKPAPAMDPTVPEEPVVPPNTLDPNPPVLGFDALPDKAPTMPTAMFRGVVDDEQARVKKALDLSAKEQAFLDGMRLGQPGDAGVESELREKFKRLLSGLRDTSRDYSAEAPMTLGKPSASRYKLSNSEQAAVTGAHDKLRQMMGPDAVGHGTKYQRRAKRALAIRGQANASYSTGRYGPPEGTIGLVGGSRIEELLRRLKLNQRGVSDIEGILWHEMGHDLDARNHRAHLAAQAFYSSRTKGAGVTNKYGFASKEDDWWHNYMGRFYRDDDTELTSMGFECLASPAQALLLYARDPEHFAFTLAQLRGRFGYSPGRNQ
ncbi:MAG: phage minor head protein [Patescibacteria group bacterium]